MRTQMIIKKKRHYLFDNAFLGLEEFGFVICASLKLVHWLQVK